MKNEVENLHKVMNETFSACEMKPVGNITGLDLRVKPYRLNSEIFAPSQKMMANNTCLHLAMSELNFIEELRNFYQK